MSLGYTLLGSASHTFPPFKAAFPWLGGDLQTIKNNLVWQVPDFPGERQTRVRLPMKDGSGDVLLGLLDRPAEATGLPLLILIHGLTGCEGSRNIMTSAAYFLSQGFTVLRLNLRGAGPSLSQCAEHYHAGRSEDLAAALSAIPDDLKKNGIALAGVSLGGNALLKFAGESFHGHGVIAVASVCAPIDLQAGQKRIMAKRNALYHRYLIRRMKADALSAARDKTAMVEVLKDVRTVFDFDDRVVAPQNGFDGALDYYAKCSAQNVLSDIKVPALLIHAATDPWIPVEMYTGRQWQTSGPVSVAITDDGGHVGFHSATTATTWHNVGIASFFKTLAGVSSP